MFTLGHPNEFKSVRNKSKQLPVTLGMIKKRVGLKINARP